MSQNISTAVMQRRFPSADSLDMFPTPPWATRALCEWLRGQGVILAPLICWEPACGHGDMVRPLEEYFAEVYASDVAAHGGEHDLIDFLFPGRCLRFDWIITNPPFALAEQFALTALDRADIGVALLVRIAFLEGIGRHQRLFSKFPPTDILQFTERVVMHKGRLSERGSTATAYCWLVWAGVHAGSPRFHWLAPCRKRLEREADYAASTSA